MEINQQDNGRGIGPSIQQPATDQTKVSPKAETPSMETLIGEEGLGIDFPKQGEVRTGVIACIGENEILVSIGTKSEGVISRHEYDNFSDEEREKFQVGSEIPVYVLHPEDPNGNVVLSYLRAKEEQDWEKVTDLLESAELIETAIIGFNKGGLLVPIGGLRGFVPASQVSLARRAAVSGETADQRWGNMVGEEINVRVIEVDRERHRLILSERLALAETRESLKDQLLEELKAGDIRSGRVTSIADFGAFVNIDGADGLIHLSEISWERINHPNEVLRVGQEVQVKVINIDQEKKRIGLSLRQLQDDPWLKKVEHLKEGQLIEGTITHLTKFGAFARLTEELEGLVHVSEISEQRIDHPKEFVKEGDVVTLRIIKIDPERRRIALSLRKVDSPAYADFDWKMALSDEVEGVKLIEDKDDSQEVETATEDGENEGAAVAEPQQNQSMQEETEASVETSTKSAVIETQVEPQQDQSIEEEADSEVETTPDEQASEAESVTENPIEDEGRSTT